jgi:hypothetical protein
MRRIIKWNSISFYFLLKFLSDKYQLFFLSRREGEGSFVFVQIFVFVFFMQNSVILYCKSSVSD